MNASTPDRGFQFPGQFEITAFATSDAGLKLLLPGLVASAGVSVIDASLRERPSRAGRFEAVAIGFFCPDRAHYERVYEMVRAHPAVKWTL
jgi:uncharacterized protein